MGLWSHRIVFLHSKVCALEETQIEVQVLRSYLCGKGNAEKAGYVLCVHCV